MIERGDRRYLFEVKAGSGQDLHRCSTASAQRTRRRCASIMGGVADPRAGTARTGRRASRLRTDYRLAPSVMMSHTSRITVPEPTASQRSRRPRTDSTFDVTHPRCHACRPREPRGSCSAGPNPSSPRRAAAAWSRRSLSRITPRRDHDVGRARAVQRAPRVSSGRGAARTYAPTSRDLRVIDRLSSAAPIWSRSMSATSCCTASTSWLFGLTLRSRCEPRGILC